MKPCEDFKRLRYQNVKGKLKQGYVRAYDTKAAQSRRWYYEFLLKVEVVSIPMLSAGALRASLFATAITATSHYLGEG